MRMTTTRRLPARLSVLILAAASAPAAPTPWGAGEPVDLDMVTRIREEGFNNSKVMDTVAHLTDVIGPRLTGSPALREANEWTRRQLESWGLQRARLESWGPFGRGWTFDRAAVHMVAPAPVPLIALPKAWTPGTDGPVRARVVREKLETDADLARLKGQLAGAVLLTGEPRELEGPDRPLFRRYTDAELDELAQYGRGDDGRRPSRPRDREGALRRARFERKLREFLADEKVLATVDASERDGALVRVAGGGSREPGESTGVTALVMAAEHYNRVARLVERGVPVELEIDVRARFLDDDRMAYNTVAEIPGTDRRGEVVMLGAHLDSWHGGTGATDNAAGCAVVMEAVRILRALDVKPWRTIRVALWTGEEQGLLGARAYVRQNFGSRPEPADPEEPAFLPPARGGAADAAPGPRAAVRLLQPRQRDRPHPRRLHPAEQRGRADLRGLAAAVRGPRRRHGLEPQHGQHGPRAVRRGRAARLPVHPGRRRLHDAHAPYEPRRVRPAAEGRPRAGGGDRRVVRVPRGDARGALPAQAAAPRAASRAVSRDDGDPLTPARRPVARTPCQPGRRC